MDNEVNEDVPEVPERGPDVNTSSRTGLGIHPNTPISVNSKSPELSYSAPSSKSPSIGQNTPTSSISANEVDNESSEEESEENEDSEESEEEDDDDDDQEESEEEEDEEVEDEVEDSDSGQDESDESEGEDETNNVHPEITAASRPQNVRDVHDADYAKRIHTAGAKEAEGVDTKLARAIKLAEQWAHKDEARLLRQKKYAEELRQQDRERREREAALKTQQEWDKWELAAIARETAAMRAEERKRREEAEAKRVAEQERRSRIEREKQWAEVIKQRNAEAKRKREAEEAQLRQREAEEAERRRRDAEEAQRRQREAEETQRRQREREKRKRTIIIDCLACMEPGEREDMAVLPCRHAYCGDCIKGMSPDSKSRKPEQPKLTSSRCFQISVQIPHPVQMLRYPRLHRNRLGSTLPLAVFHPQVLQPRPRTLNPAPKILFLPILLPLPPTRSLQRPLDNLPKMQDSHMHTLHKTRARRSLQARQRRNPC